MVKYPDVIVVVVSLHFDDRYAPAAVDGQDVCCQLIEKHIFTETNCPFGALEKATRWTSNETPRRHS